MAVCSVLKFPARFFFWLMISLMGFHSSAQNIPAKFVQETHYLLSLPEGYDSDTGKRWPLLIFLHGSGERGDDLAKVKVHGPPRLVEEGRKFPFIVVSPQAPLGSGWDASTLYKLLQHLKSSKRVDHRKVYLTGLSMGGYGTWDLAMEHPEEFAAIAPVCGGGDSTKAWRLRNIPIWNFHGAKDDVVYPEQSEQMVAAARKHNPNVRYTLYPDANHNSWDLTYSNDSLYLWMLAQTRFEFVETPVDVSQLRQFAGKYVKSAGDTLGISVTDGKLLATVRRDSFYLKQFAKDKFFISPEFPVEIHFLRKAGKVNSFMVLDSDRTIYRKIK